MSNPAEEAAPPRSRIRRFFKPEMDIDTLAHIFTLVVAVAGMAKFFYDQDQATKAENRERAITYINAYTEDPLLGTRQSLYDFWAGQPELVAMMRGQQMTPRNYAAMLQASVFRTGAAEPIREPLLVLDSFYSQVSFCESAGLCDTAIIDRYFCEHARRDAQAYAPFFAHLRTQSGDTRIGVELANFAGRCTPTGAEPPTG
ncbi:hypothetical protein [Vannielia litorea]|uniref:hypothetical protein n=1 Tax=Vannielia litorea TaxID=1217970 RepID=UPI001C94BF64|nr:hypothetical protein [Vannielia litorea]MBY6048351.1 hypothetical protein [Vannielia litorea]MBY6075765.1 hypothetical protein [Vannielia litorea]